MARPEITLSDLQVQEVETLAALLNQDQIADFLGISRTTFRAICARDDEASVRYKRGKAKAIAHVASGLLQKARTGDTTSMIFYLKTQAYWRETDRSQDNEPDVAKGDGRDTLTQFLDQIAEKNRRIGVDYQKLPVSPVERTSDHAR